MTPDRWRLRAEDTSSGFGIVDSSRSARRLPCLNLEILTIRRELPHIA
ncbi:MULTISPECIES: hypothetical protein [unclassified Microcoleus]|nr:MULTISPECIES: hypothetical protein [unclassified Microcoleus]